MPFKVFVSYSANPEDQAVVWRLQTLAATHGIQVYIPHRPGLTLPTASLAQSSAVHRAIDEADLVLAIITTKTSPAVENELNYALGRNKLIIPIVSTEVQNPALFGRFARVFRFSSGDLPGKLETEVIEYLKTEKLSKDRLQAIGALIAVGLGLLLLSAAAKE